mmetsp:Transcript_43891/g.73073  ORF Transcript_43891/g.73073 Transcript_43891/m.73073 type:complete len:113 (+) Transcript_43891:132-470(+)
MLTSSHPIIGVFDGHGCLGHSAAQLCKRVLPLVLSSVLVKDDTPEDAAITAFGETQELLLRMAFSEQKEYDRLQKRWLAFQSVPTRWTRESRKGKRRRAHNAHTHTPACSVR